MELPVNIVNVNVLDNPTVATNPFQFEIVFESQVDLEEGTMCLFYFHLRFGVANDVCWRLPQCRERSDLGVCACRTDYSRNTQILLPGR